MARWLAFVGGEGIDPTTHKEGSQMQFMSCPGPNEKMNMRSTNEFYGAADGGPAGARVRGDDGRPKPATPCSRAQWFQARDIDRIDVGTKRYPATRKEAKRALGDVTNGQVEGGKETKRAKKSA